MVGAFVGLYLVLHAAPTSTCAARAAIACAMLGICRSPWRCWRSQRIARCAVIQNRPHHVLQNLAAVYTLWAAEMAFPRRIFPTSRESFPFGPTPAPRARSSSSRRSAADGCSLGSYRAHAHRRHQRDRRKPRTRGAARVDVNQVVLGHLRDRSGIARHAGLLDGVKELGISRHGVRGSR